MRKSQCKSLRTTTPKFYAETYAFLRRIVREYPADSIDSLAGLGFLELPFRVSSMDDSGLTNGRVSQAFVKKVVPVIPL
jgi:hypothetical protein